MFTYNLSIFLTSTAFVSTNAKYGIPLSRYAVFLKNCPLEQRSIVARFLYVVCVYFREGKPLPYGICVYLCRGGVSPPVFLRYTNKLSINQPVILSEMRSNLRSRTSAKRIAERKREAFKPTRDMA